MSPDVRKRLTGEAVPLLDSAASRGSSKNLEKAQSAGILKEKRNSTKSQQTAKRETHDQALSPKTMSIEAVSPRDMQREVREAACDPIDFEAERKISPKATPKVLNIQKQLTLDDINQDWEKS